MSPTFNRHAFVPFIILAALLLAVPLAWAQEAANPPEVEMYRPTQMPDRILLTWTGNPVENQAVTWRTSVGAGDAVAQIHPADPGRSFEDRAQTVRASTSELSTKHWTAAYHTARFEGLEPDTAYVYRVGNGKQWSEWFQFRTAKQTPAPFTFLYFGDVQTSIRSLWPRVLREAYRTAPDARFMVFAGDLVDDGSNDILWGEFLDAGGWLFGMVPAVPSPGNHEYRKDEDDERRLARNWGAQFRMPANGPEEVAHGVYYIDYQGLRMISLNSNEGTDRQAFWLEEVLASSPAMWTAIVFHHPLRSVSKGRTDNQRLIDQWKPLFDKHKVDLVLTGHDHTYGRSGLESSTVYVTSVGGGKMYDIDRKPWMKRAAQLTQLYQVFRIDGNKLSMETRTATGSLYDAFELRKGGGRVWFTDKAPADVPERVPAQDSN